MLSKIALHGHKTRTHKKDKSKFYQQVEVLKSEGKTLREIGPILGMSFSWVRRKFNKETAQLYPDPESESESIVAVNSQKVISSLPRFSKHSNINRSKATIPENPNSDFPYDVLFNQITDTRSWSWNKWTKHFMGIDLFLYQIDILLAMDKDPTVIIVSRQHGKTSLLRVYITRKLCETVFNYLERNDRPILYVSNSETLLKKMSIVIRADLMLNPAIVEHYGVLVDRQKTHGLTTASQTLREIRLITLIDRFLVSFMANTPLSNVRGNNTHDTIIDDVIDYKEAKKNITRARQNTRDIIDWVINKIYPLTKGNLIWSGTRYDKQDIFYYCAEQNIYKTFTYPAILGGVVPSFTLRKKEEGEIYRATDILIEDEAKYEKLMLAKELFIPHEKLKSVLHSGTPMQNLMFKLFMSDMISFMQEYMCVPATYESQLNIEDLQEYVSLPAATSDIEWVIFIDPASGKTAASNVTSIVCVGFYQYQFYIYDIISGRWDALDKQTKLEDFYNLMRQVLNLDSIPLLIEVIRDQDFYNRIVRESWLTPMKNNPKERGEKEDRIVHNFGAELKNKVIHIKHNSRDRAELETEMLGFPDHHPDIIDSLDQGMYYLKNETVEGVEIRGF